jgi:hypothetical protein
MRAAIMLPEGHAARNHIIRRTRTNARERGYACELTTEQMLVLMAQPCHYCGAQPSNKSKNPYYHGAYVYSGIDRVDNDKGYLLDNVVPCCIHCNVAKRSRTRDEFLAWVEAVYLHAVASRAGVRH